VYFIIITGIYSYSKYVRKKAKTSKFQTVHRNSVIQYTYAAVGVV